MPSSAALDPALRAFATPAVIEQIKVDAMQETSLFLEDILLKQSQSPLAIITADYSFVNSNLARIYGISGVGGTAFVRATLPSNRRGIFSHASFLMGSTGGTETNIPRRGKFILDKVLCEPLPPTPPGVNTNLPSAQNLTRRQLLEQGTSGGNCAGCHGTLNALGGSLEAFGILGQFRTNYSFGNTFPVDSTGRLPDGRTLAGPQDLSRILTEDARFRACMTTKVLSFALGRVTRSGDVNTINRISAQVTSQNRFADLVKQIVLSEPFLTVRGGTN